VGDQALEEGERGEQGSYPIQGIIRDSEVIERGPGHHWPSKKKKKSGGPGTSDRGGEAQPIVLGEKGAYEGAWRGCGQVGG